MCHVLCAGIRVPEDGKVLSLAARSDKFGNKVEDKVSGKTRYQGRERRRP